MKAIYDRELRSHLNGMTGAVAVGFADTPDGLPERSPLPRTGNRVEYI